MVELVMVILGIALFLYTVLGGADFGAGMVETLAGKRSIGTISKALAPVWEANHVWLILVIVVVFNGFPKVYSTLSYALHIPLMIILVGIIFRGAAFTFRHYDVIEDDSHWYYTFFFRVSSFITPFFLGVTLGAMILGKMTMEESRGFYEVFIGPWLNSFCISLGIFSTLLFSYLSSLFLIAEVETEKGRVTVTRYAKVALIALMLAGVLVLFTAHVEGFPLFWLFLAEPASIICVFMATGTIPFLSRAVKRNNFQQIRLLAGLQVACIFLGWAIVQFPDFIRLQDGTTLNIYNSSAPPATFRQLVIALVVGVLLILPASAYLYRVFKFSDR